MAIQNSYPVQLLVAGRSCLVVGAGKIAFRKIGGLLAAGAKVTVIAPAIDSRIRELDVTIIERAYLEGEAAEYQLVITCTDDPRTNRLVFRDAEAAGVWINSADDPVNCSFILPAVARRGDLTLTISTNGKSPALATWLRQRFEAEFDERYETLLDLLADVRAEARAVLGTSEVVGWNEGLDGGAFELVASGRIAEARDILRAAIGLPDLVAAPDGLETV